MKNRLQEHFGKRKVQTEINGKPTITANSSRRKKTMQRKKLSLYRLL